MARYSQFDDHHLVDIKSEAVDEETVSLGVRTSQSGVGIAEVVRTRITRAGMPLSPERGLLEEPAFIAHEFSVNAEALQPITIEKVVTLFTSRDRSISEPLEDARPWIGRIGSFNELQQRPQARMGRPVEAVLPRRGVR